MTRRRLQVGDELVRVRAGVGEVGRVVVVSVDHATRRAVVREEGESAVSENELDLDAIERECREWNAPPWAMERMSALVAAVRELRMLLQRSAAERSAATKRATRAEAEVERLRELLRGLHDNERIVYAVERDEARAERDEARARIAELEAENRRLIACARFATWRA